MSLTMTRLKVIVRFCSYLHIALAVCMYVCVTMYICTIPKPFGVQLKTRMAKTTTTHIVSAQTTFAIQ